MPELHRSLSTEAGKRACYTLIEVLALISCLLVSKQPWIHSDNPHLGIQQLTLSEVRVDALNPTAAYIFYSGSEFNMLLP